MPAGCVIADGVGLIALVALARAAVCLAGYAAWGASGAAAVGLVGLVLSGILQVRHDPRPRRVDHDWVQFLDTHEVRDKAAKR